MRKFIATMGLLAGMACVAPQAVAGGWNFAAKTGPMLIDQSGVDDPTNVGVTAGYDLGILAGDLGIEGEYTTSIDKGSTPTGRDLNVDTAGLYAAFRSAGPIYLIAKAGGAWIDRTGHGSDTGASYGLGVGFSLALVQLELEYTRIHNNVDFLSVGVRF